MPKRAANYGSFLDDSEDAEVELTRANNAGSDGAEIEQILAASYNGSDLSGQGISKPGEGSKAVQEFHQQQQQSIEDILNSTDKSFSRVLKEIKQEDQEESFKLGKVSEAQSTPRRPDSSTARGTSKRPQVEVISSNTHSA